MRRLIAGLAAAGLLAGAAVPGAASAELPDGLAYELVSPLASRGFDFTRAWLLPDGDRAIVGSELSDVNGIYPVRRTASAWEQVGRRGLNPPNGTPLIAAGTADISEDLSRIVVSAVRREVADPNDIVVDRLALGAEDGSWRIVGAGLQYAGGSPDLRRLVVRAWWGQHDDERYPGMPGRETGVYLWQDNGSDDGAVTPIGTDASRVLACGAEVPDGSAMRALGQTGIARDADTVVLTSRPGCADPDDATPLPSHVFRWHDGVTTDLTAPGGGDADGASSYVGSTRDLGSVFFRTGVAFDPADGNGAADLYRWDAATGARTRLTGAATDGGDEALESALSADDGGRVWFSTRDVDDGAESLWTAARGEAAVRIATATEAAPTGRAFDLDNSAPGSNGRGFPAQASADGDVVVFTSGAKIAGRGGAVDVNDPGQLFRATADGQVDCLSCRDDGSSAENVGPGGRVDGIVWPNRVISDDGRWIWFETTSALDDGDRNDLPDVYVWHDGARSLASGGEPGIRAQLANVSARGDALFKTYAQLLPWIDDDHLKVYVARIGGGLPAPADPREPCLGDGCQGGPAPRQGEGPSATEGFSGPGDADEPAPPFAAKPALTVRPLSAAARRRLARGRAVTVTARSNTAGRVTATTRFRSGRRWAKASSAGRKVARGGSVRLTVRLSRAARTRLARHRTLRIRIDVVHTQVAAPRRLQLVLKRPAPTRRGADA